VEGFYVWKGFYATLLPCVSMCSQNLILLLAAVCLFAFAAGCRLFVQPEYKELNKNNKLASRIQYAAKF
jgi:hypothetical protein